MRKIVFLIFLFNFLFADIILNGYIHVGDNYFSNYIPTDPINYNGEHTYDYYKKYPTNFYLSSDIKLKGVELVDADGIESDDDIKVYIDGNLVGTGEEGSNTIMFASEISLDKGYHTIWIEGSCYLNTRFDSIKVNCTSNLVNDIDDFYFSAYKLITDDNNTAINFIRRIHIGDSDDDTEFYDDLSDNSAIPFYYPDSPDAKRGAEYYFKLNCNANGIDFNITRLRDVQIETNKLYLYKNNTLIQVYNLPENVSRDSYQNVFISYKGNISSDDNLSVIIYNDYASSDDLDDFSWDELIIIPHCNNAQQETNGTFNAVDYVASNCNAVNDWDDNITTKIVNKDFNLTILAKDKDLNTPLEANITRVDFYEYNTNDCSGDYDVENICTNCGQTSVNGCLAVSDIKIDKAIKCIKVHIEGNVTNPINPIQESNSTDDFSIRPYEFKITNIPSIIKAGEDFNITLEALDYEGNSAKNYNESVNINGNSPDLEYNISKSGCYNGNLQIVNGGNFKDGKANVTLNYNEVGEVNLTLKEVNGSEFALADNDDTSLDNRLISAYKTQIYVIPHHFKVEENLSNYDNNFTYLDKNLSLYSVLDINITAENKNNETTRNYNEACYAKDIEINISKNLSPFPDNLNDIVYFYKDAKNDKSDVFSQDINDTIEINYTDTNFTTDDNGSTKITLFINFDRNFSKPVNPFEMNITEINVSDEDGTYGTDTSVEGNATYYYGSVTLFDEVANKNEFDTREDYFIIYDNNSTDNKLPSDNEILPDWYLNIYHQSIDGNISNNNIVVSRDYNASNQINGVDVSVNPINNGKFSFHIKRTDSSVKFVVIHLLEPNLKWLWYSKFGNKYNDSNDSTCLNHFCFTITWKDNGEKGVIKSGEVNGTETNVTDDNVTKRGVKIFR